MEQPLLEGTNTDTGPMWAIALLPLLNPLVDLIPVPNGPLVGPGSTPAGILSLTLGLLLLTTEVLLAAADRRILIGRGLIRPMHWGWAFLDVVYIVGRSVVVRRRVRGSLRPLSLWIVTMAVSMAIDSLLL